MQIELQTPDVRMLVQSLEHCLATCKHKTHGQDEPCEDCGRARELHARLKLLLAV